MLNLRSRKREGANLFLVLFTCFAFLASGCYGRGGRSFGAFLAGAIITAAVISAVRPPPPREVYVPAPRPGYAWQPGYWTRDGDDWAWVEGRWVPLPPHYAWQPTHWEQAPDGTWQLVPGRWVSI